MVCQKPMKNAFSFNLGLAALVFTALNLDAQPTAPSFTIGKSVYGQHCAACHGELGDGNGPASVWLYPKPRNFSAGLFKIKSTPGQSLPTDEDLLRSVTRGLPGSSMPIQTLLDSSSAVSTKQPATARSPSQWKCHLNRRWESRN